MSSKRRNAVFVAEFLDETETFGVQIFLKRGTAGAPDYLIYVPRRFWSHAQQTAGKQDTDELVLGSWAQLTALAKRAEEFIKKHMQNPGSALETVCTEQQRKLKEAA